MTATAERRRAARSLDKSLIAELVAIIAVPLILIGTPSQGLRFLALVTLAAYCLWRLRRAGAQPGYLRLNWAGCLVALPGILLRSAIAWAAVLALVYWLYPYQLLWLAWHQPTFVLVIVFGYSLISVPPQEIAFRSYAAWRLDGLGTPFLPAALISAAAYGWVHILFGSWLSVLLTLLAGIVFYRTYRTSQSLAAVWLEHCLFGTAVFVLGLGSLFYRG